MLKSILKLNGVQKLSKQEQRSISGQGLDSPLTCSLPEGTPCGSSKTLICCNRICVPRDLTTDSCPTHK